MRKADLIDQVSQQTGVSRIDVMITVGATLSTIKNRLADGGSVFLRGFGTFSPKHRKAKLGRNIKRGLPVAIPAHDVPHFKPAEDFKAAMKRPANGLNPSTK